MSCSWKSATCTPCAEAFGDVVGKLLPQRRDRLQFLLQAFAQLGKLGELLLGGPQVALQLGQRGERGGGIAVDDCSGRLLLLLDRSGSRLQRLRGKTVAQRLLEIRFELPQAAFQRPRLFVGFGLLGRQLPQLIQQSLQALLERLQLGDDGGGILLGRLLRRFEPGQFLLPLPLRFVHSKTRGATRIDLLSGLLLELTSRREGRFRTALHFRSSPRGRLLTVSLLGVAGPNELFGGLEQRP